MSRLTDIQSRLDRAIAAKYNYGSVGAHKDIVYLLNLVSIYREALESYAGLPNGPWAGPDDSYTDLGDGARAALKAGEEV